MPAAKRHRKSKHRCAICNRRLEVDRWVFSRHTGNRYCLPGRGCQKAKGAA